MLDANGTLFANGDIKEIIFQTRSRMAELIGYKDSKGTWVEKRPCPWDLEPLSAQERRAQCSLINSLTSHFKNGLMHQRMPLPSTYEFRQTSDGYPVHLISYEGRNCVQELVSCPSDSQYLIGLIIQAIRGILEQEEPWQFTPDMRPDNFAINGNRSVIFVDIFPPLCRDSTGVYWVHYPNPSDTAIIEREKTRKFSLVGAVRRLRFFLMWIHAELEEILERQLRLNLPESLAKRIISEYEMLPDKVLVGMSAPDRRKYICLIPDNQEDVIRELSVRLVPESNERTSILNTIFRLSSAYTDSDERGSQPERFTRAKEILIQAAGLE